MKQLSKITRRGLGALSAAVFGLAVSVGISPAFAAGSVGWLSPANGSVFPVGEMVMPNGEANASGVIGAGLEIALALDSSGSMGTRITTLPGSPTRREVQAQAATALVDALPSGTAMAVIDFDSNAFVAQSLTVLPGGAGDLKSAISGINASGGTNFTAAINEAATELTTNGSAAANKQILLISDGQSGGNAIAAASAAKANGITVNTVSFPGGDVAALQAIATAGGGTFTNFTSNVQDIVDIFSGAGGGVLVGVSGVEITDPDGVTYAAAVDAVGGFKANAYNLKAGANTWTALATFTDGSTATASLTLNGRTGTTPPVVPPIPLPATAFLLGAALIALPLRRRRRS